MPQIYQVLKCYKCHVFQVHQTKKSNKFVCKMCGEKQSIKRHYGIGNGQECRIHVQKLNTMRGESDESKTLECLTSEEEDIPIPIEPMKKKQSKWSAFIEKDEVCVTNNEEDGVMLLENKEVVLELPTKTNKKKSKNNSRYYTEWQESTEKLNIETDTDQDKTNIECNIINEIPSISKSQKNAKFEHQKKIQLPSDYDNIENNSVNSNNFTSHIQSKDMELHKAKKMKFVHPIINSNSKWTKFIDNGNDEQNDIQDTESSSSNFDIIEIDKGLDYDSADKSIENGYASQMAVIRNHNDKTDPSINTDECIEREFDLTDHTISRYNDCNSRNKIINTMPIIINQKQANHKRYSTIPNTLVDCKNNNLDNNDTYKSQNISQKKIKDLFFLCDDDEIENILEF